MKFATTANPTIITIIIAGNKTASGWTNQQAAARTSVAIRYLVVCSVLKTTR